MEKKIETTLMGYILKLIKDAYYMFPQAGTTPPDPNSHQFGYKTTISEPKVGRNYILSRYLGRPKTRRLFFESPHSKILIN